jgi:hypothetical protein
VALIDTSFMLTDPDFTDNFTLVKRGVSVNSLGETVLSVTSSAVVTGVVQSGDTDDLVLAPTGATLSDIITVYYRGELSVERINGYSDVIIWKGRRYTVQDIVGDWNNWGQGFTKVLCVLEQITNG